MIRIHKTIPYVHLSRKIKTKTSQPNRRISWGWLSEILVAFQEHPAPSPLPPCCQRDASALWRDGSPPALEEFRAVITEFSVIYHHLNPNVSQPCLMAVGSTERRSEWHKWCDYDDLTWAWMGDDHLDDASSSLFFIAQHISGYQCQWIEFEVFLAADQTPFHLMVCQFSCCLPMLSLNLSHQHLQMFWLIWFGWLPFFVEEIFVKTFPHKKVVKRTTPLLYIFYWVFSLRYLISFPQFSN